MLCGLTIETGEERICRALLDDQPRSGRKWNDGLREAAARGMLDVTFQLVQLGADVNSATVTGRTALLGAAANGHIQTVELLLRCGADPKLKDRNGRSVLVVAKEKGRHDVARLLGDERRVRELQVDRAIAVEPGRCSRAAVRRRSCAVARR